MSDLTYAEFRAQRDAMTTVEWQRVQDKARWEAMTPWAVLNEWPSLRAAAVPVEETPGKEPE